MGISVSTSWRRALRALESDGQANILSQPSILTADNLGSMIDLSDTFYIRTLGERVATVTPCHGGYVVACDATLYRRQGGRQVELAKSISRTDGSCRSIPSMVCPGPEESSISTLAVVGGRAKRC